MEDVAREAGVSRALVSLVMNGSPKVSDEKRRAVLAASRQLGYQPNLLARNLAQQRTQTIGVLVDDLHNPFFSEVIDGVEAEASRHDLRVLILNGGRDPAREAQALELFVQLRVEAMVLIGSRLDDDLLEETGRRIPIVVVAAGTDHPGVDTITTDETTGAHLAVDHLITLGHHHILHIDGGSNASARPRRSGYEASMAAAGLTARVVTGGDTEAAAAAAGPALAGADRPTAVFAFNDLVAAGLLELLDDLQLRVPGDVSVVGYDNTFIAGLHQLSLTTIDQPRAEMGRLAVDTLRERIEDGRIEPVHHRLEPTLVPRGTSGTTNGAAPENTP